MLKTRVLSALVFVPVLVALVYVGGPALELACFVLSVLMLWEFYRLVLGETGFWVTRLMGTALGLLACVSLLGWMQLPPFLVAAPLLIIAALMGVLSRPQPLETAMARVGFVLLGALYCGALIPYLALVRQGQQGLAIAFVVLLGTWAADTGAYFVGRALGRHKLYPTVSPGKTIEGGLGGVAAGIIAAFLVDLILDTSLDATRLALLGGLVAILGIIGDLAESLLKRSVGKKDSSRLIPGHGGVLDRFDALMFSAPGAYLLLHFLPSA